MTELPPPLAGPLLRVPLETEPFEPLQALAHAARAVELAGPTEAPRIERLFRRALRDALSNDGATGDTVYDRVVASHRPD